MNKKIENVATVESHTLINKKEKNKINERDICTNASNFSVKNSAITLIALIITIIVLLILAGVTLNMVIGENGIFGKANFSSFETEYSSVKEQIELSIVNQQIENNTGEKIVIKYPIDENQKVELSSIEQTLVETIKETENIQSLTTENVKLYKVDLTKLNTETKREYVINVKTGELYALKGVKYKNKTYHRINESVETKNEESADNEYENQKILDIDTSAISEIENKCTKVNDLSGNENNAVLNNIILNDTKDSIKFLGDTSSFGEIEKENLEIAFPCTISFAIKPENTGNTVFVFADPISKTTFSIYSGYIYCSGDNSNIYKVPLDMYDGKIKYITIVYNTGVTDHQLYINGEKIQKSDTIDYWNLTGTRFIFGERYYKGYNGPYLGNLYNFIVYNNVLTEEQIKNNYIEDKNYIENNEQKASNRSNTFIEYDFKNISSLSIIEEIKSINDQSNLQNKVNFVNTLYNKTEKAMEFNGDSSLGKVQLKEPITYPCTINYVIKPQKEKRWVLFSDYNSKAMLAVYDDYIYCAHLTSTIYSEPKDFFDGNKKYITVVYGENATISQLYINGKKIEKSNNADYFNVDSTLDTYIGNRNYSTSYYYPYKGLVYSIKIYIKNLTEKNVEKLYSEELKKYGE